MYAYKPFLSQDLIVSPFIVNKSFYFEGDQITGSGIDLFTGQNITGSFYHQEQSQSGQIQLQYRKLIYDSIKFRYYSNYLSSSLGDDNSRRILIPGQNQEGDDYVGSVSNPINENFLQTTLSYPRYFYTASNSESAVISVPVNLYGDNIKPGSFRLKKSVYFSDDFSFRDDGEGNILENVTNNIVGNIFYSDGMVVINKPFNGGYWMNWSFWWWSFDPTPPGIVNPLDPLTGFTSIIFFFESSNPSMGPLNLLEFTNGDPTMTNYCRIPIGISIDDWYIQHLIPALEAIPEINDNFYVRYVASASFAEYPPGSNMSSGNASSDVYFENTGVSSSIFLERKGGVVVPFDYIFWGLDVMGGVNVETQVEPYSILEISNSLVTSSLYGLTCSFSSSYTINENQYKCTIKDHEFNFSLNPSLIKNDSTGSVRDFVTGSEFVPYITTIGLYDDNKELLAVAKLSQPLPMSSTTDTSIIINIDR